MTDAPRIDRPMPGYYRTRLIRSGPFVGARIYWSVAKDEDTGEPLDRSPVLLAELRGEFIDPYELWPRVSGREIAKAEYDYLMADAQWADAYEPADPIANPTRRVDVRAMQPIGPAGAAK